MYINLFKVLKFVGNNVNIFIYKLFCLVFKMFILYYIVIKIHFTF